MPSQTLGTLAAKPFKLNQILPALIGLIGVLTGGLISFFTSLMLKRRETQLRIVEKVFDRRIKAHEDILSIAQRLRTTISTNTVDHDHNAQTYPSILHSIEFLENFKGHYYEMVNPNLIWIDVEIQKELNYIQDYVESLTNHLIQIPEHHYIAIGLKLKGDILDLAASLEEKVRAFFKKDIYSVNLKVAEGYHKYERIVTVNRFYHSVLGQSVAWLDSLKT